MKKINVLLFACLLAVCCKPSDNQQSEHHDHHHGEMDHSAMEHTAPSDLSVYNVGSVWEDQNGDTLRLQHLAGKAQVVAMMYSSCGYTCPRILADMKTIETMLGGDRDKVGMVLVTIDPERDTPEKLKAFAGQQDIGDWVLLHGNEPDIRELSALLGVQYKRTSDTDFSHSNMLTVLDEQGEVAYQQVGLGGGLAETIAAIKSVVANNL